MSAPPDLSVIVPTFRRPALVVEAVESALAQQGVALDVHVLDDSPEGSAREAIAAIADPRVRYTRCERPSGGRPGLVRNQGAAPAAGRYLHFLDDDDRVAEGAYAALVGALDAAPGAGVAFGCIAPFGAEPAAVLHETAYFEDAARRARRAAALGSRRWVVTNMLFRPTLLVNSACVIRREAFAALGGYDGGVALVEDVDLYARAIRRFGFRFLDRVVLHYRVGHSSLMHDAPQSAALLASYERMYGLYRERWGGAELNALRLLSRTVLRWL